MLKFAVKREQSQACLGLSYCHAELVSASHREPLLVLLRGQILKRVQDDGGKCWPLPIKRLKDGDVQYRGTFKSSATLPFRVFTDAISILSFYISTGSRTRGYSPFGLRVFADAFER